MSHHKWRNHIEHLANGVLGTKMINWREVTFNWAERHQADELDVDVVNALINAAEKQLGAALRRRISVE